MPNNVTINVDVLEKLSRALSNKLPTAKVGVLSSTAGRSGDGPNNAEVGAAHEFGTSKLPIRSFLRMPLEEKLNGEIEKSRDFSEDKFKEVIATGNAAPWMEIIAALAEGIVIDAFGSGGFGKWAKWKGNYSNSTGDVLVDTQQLERSITHEVIK